MQLTTYQEHVVAMSRKAADDPDSIIAAHGVDFTGDPNGRTAYLLGYTRNQLKALLEVVAQLTETGGQ